jgi:hypothetical protein
MAALVGVKLERTSESLLSRIDFWGSQARRGGLDGGICQSCKRCRYRWNRRNACVVTSVVHDKGRRREESIDMLSTVHSTQSCPSTANTNPPLTDVTSTSEDQFRSRLGLRLEGARSRKIEIDIRLQVATTGAQLILQVVLSAAFVDIE